MDVPVIGEECAGYDQSDSSSAGYFLIWRYHEAVILLMYSGDELEAEEVVSLAQTVQDRLEAG